MNIRQKHTSHLSTTNKNNKFQTLTICVNSENSFSFYDIIADA